MSSIDTHTHTRTHRNKKYKPLLKWNRVECPIRRDPPIAEKATQFWQHETLFGVILYLRFPFMPACDGWYFRPVDGGQFGKFTTIIDAKEFAETRSARVLFVA